MWTTKKDGPQAAQHNHHITKEILRPFAVIPTFRKYFYGTSQLEKRSLRSYHEDTKKE